MSSTCRRITSRAADSFVCCSAVSGWRPGPKLNPRRLVARRNPSGKSPAAKIASKTFRSADRRQVDGACKHRYVVKRHIDRAVESDLAEVGENAVGREAVVEGRHDRYRAGAISQICLAGHRITIDPAVCMGKPCIRDLRFPVSRILGLLAAGQTAEEIVAAYPYLEPADIRQALEYAASLAEDENLELTR